jgi:hypothetical protein
MGTKLMGMRREAAIVRREGTSPFQRLTRLALVLYLSPVILAVLAIGLVGMVAASIVKPVARVAIKGAHSAHKPTKPLGIATTPTHVREMV